MKRFSPHLNVTVEVCDMKINLQIYAYKIAFSNNVWDTFATKEPCCTTRLDIAFKKVFNSQINLEMLEVSKSLLRLGTGVKRQKNQHR